MTYFYILQERKASERDAQQHIYFVDEDNHTVLAGIRACQLLGSYETAMVLLTTCEARWARGPLARELNDVATGAEAYHNWDWRDITVRTRESRRCSVACGLGYRYRTVSDTVSIPILFAACA